MARSQRKSRGSSGTNKKLPLNQSIHYYDLKIRSTLGAASNDSVIEVASDGARVRKINKNELAGAILDVFAPEPIASNSKLWNTANLVITPHVSADDGESYVRLTLELFMKILVTTNAQTINACTN